MKRHLILALSLLATSISCWSQALVNGVQPSAINGIPVTTGFQFNGITLTPPGGSGGAPTLVQSATTGDAGRDDLINMGSNLTTGDILVVLQYGGSFGATLTATDTAGLTFTVLATGGLSADDDAMAISCAPITTSSGDQVDLFVNGSRGQQRATVYEFSNATCTPDVSAPANKNTTSATANLSNSITTTTANDLVLGMGGNDGTNTSLLTVGSGWTGTVTATSLVLSGYRIAATPGSFTFTSSTFPSEEQAAIVVALKP